MSFILTNIEIKEHIKILVNESDVVIDRIKATAIAHLSKLTLSTETELYASNSKDYVDSIILGWMEHLSNHRGTYTTDKLEAVPHGLILATNTIRKKTVGASE